MALRAAKMVGEREGRLIRRPREPDPRVDRDVEAEEDPAPST